MTSLIAIFREMPDHGVATREAPTARYLTIALVASMCRAKSCVDFAEFASRSCAIENGLLSHETFSRVFWLLDPAAFGRAFGAFLAEFGADGAGVRAIDGKTLRRSFDPRRAARLSRRRRLWGGRAAELQPARVAPGENEITTAPRCWPR